MNNKDTYYATYKNRRVDLYNMDKSLIRRFNMKADVVNAQVTGFGQDAVIAITMSNGRTELYKSNGTLIRR